MFENFSYAYPSVQPKADSVWVLDGVDLRIEAGEFVAIMGATGGGKTTLCLALNGIVPHSTGGVIGGEVIVAGQNSKRQSVAELAQTVGLVFQEPETQLFNMTVEAEVAFGLETLGLAPAEMEQRITWALELVGMSGFRQRSPFELSGGQKQRVAIAAILAMKPPVLVLDEPTANLDPMGKREVFAVVELLRRQEGMTIIMVSHEAAQIGAFADRVVVLGQGKVVLDGSPSEVFSQTAVFHTLGLATPPLTQLASHLHHKGLDGSFTTVDEAVRSLRPFIKPTTPHHSEQKEGKTAVSSPLFTLDTVSYHYRPQQIALDNISLTIERGEFVAILGQNGSGKTTLAKQLNGLLRPTAGTVRLNGEDIVAKSVATLARTVGYVFQNPDHMIFSPTVREELAAGPRNLGLAEEVVVERVEQMLEQFRLRPYADQQPAVLSFGLRRKVSVAAVVAMQTAVLILDEPTSGLDQRSSDDLMGVLTELHAGGHTILLITHDMELVANDVPRVLLLQNGRLLAHGHTRDIFQQTDLLRQTQLEQPLMMLLGNQLGLTTLTVEDLIQNVAARDDNQPLISNLQ